MVEGSELSVALCCVFQREPLLISTAMSQVAGQLTSGFLDGRRVEGSRFKAARRELPKERESEGATGKQANGRGQSEPKQREREDEGEGEK